MKYKASIWTEEILIVEAKNKHDAETMVLEGLGNDEIRGTAEIKIERYKK